MNDDRAQLDSEEALLAFGDRLARGETPAPRTELEALAARVHHALQSAAPAPGVRTASRKATMWEEIMQSVTPSIPAAGRVYPAAPSPGHQLPNRRAGIPARRTSGPMSWTGLANAALALLILLAGLTAWRALDGRRDPDDGERATTIPAVAMTASVTPAPGEAEGAITACDLRGDLPIVPDVSTNQTQPPVPGTSLFIVRDPAAWQDPRGVLKIGCADDPGSVLAEDVYSAGPGPWPGVVSVQILPPGTDDLGAMVQQYVEIATGASVTFGVHGQWVGIAQVDGSPWVAGPDPDDPSTLAVADLRTMELATVARITGTAVPAEMLRSLAEPAEDGTTAVVLSRRADPQRAQGTAVTGPDVPGDLLILGASFDHAHWLSLPAELTAVTTLTMSPDARHLAAMGPPGDDASTYVLTLLDAADGAVTASVEGITTESEPVLAWMDNGRSIAFVDGMRLRLLTVAGGEPATAFAAASSLSALQTTWDPNVLTVTTWANRDADAPADTPGRDMVYAVNVQTGAVREFAGIDASRMVGWIRDGGALVLFDWDDAYPDTTSYRVIDPVTGTRIGEIANAPSAIVSPRTLPTIGPRSVSVSTDGRTEVIALGTQRVYAITVGPDGTSMRQLASPGLLGDLFLTASLFVSPDGAQLSLTGNEDEGRTRYLLRLDDPDAEWAELPNVVPGERGRGLILFTPGVGA